MSPKTLARLLFGICVISSAVAGAVTHEKCRHCHATGRCQHCSGDGKLEACSACNGSGQVRTSSSDLSEPDAVHYVSCPHCHGSGEKLCYYCKASGSCRHCSGGVVYADSALPGTAIEPVSTAVRPSAVFTKFYDEQNVVRDGVRGMLIHADFVVYDGKDDPMELNAYLAYPNGQKLKDTDGQYASADGQVGASNAICPGFSTATYKDAQLFIPYTQLHLKKRGWQQLKFHLEVYSRGHGRLIQSPVFSFRVKR